MVDDMNSDNERDAGTTPTDSEMDESGEHSSAPGAAATTRSGKGREPVNHVAGETARETVVEEIGGRSGPDPSRYGDWEKNGRCIDF
jgi:hypothetical protein